jgi:hypothetical protein
VSKLIIYLVAVVCFIVASSSWSGSLVTFPQLAPQLADVFMNSGSEIGQLQGLIAPTSQIQVAETKELINDLQHRAYEQSIFVRNALDKQIVKNVVFKVKRDVIEGRSQILAVIGFIDIDVATKLKESGEINSRDIARVTIESLNYILAKGAELSKILESKGNDVDYNVTKGNLLIAIGNYTVFMGFCHTLAIES